MDTGATTNSPSDAKLAALDAIKGWAKLTDTEKIERLRDIVKQGQYHINRIYQLENKIQKLRTLFIQHSHTAIGVVSKVAEYDNLDAGCDKASVSSPKNLEDVYF